MNIGNKKINPENSTYIIAEAGINHNGDIKIAKELIKTASKCGANAIKFQSFIPEELFSEKNNKENLQFAQKWAISKAQHNELMKFAKTQKIEFISTATGSKSLEMLKKLKVNAIKLASMDLNNHEMLREAAKTHIPLIVSTGMSTISEVVSAVEVLKKENADFCLLHCVSSYPTSIKDANLATIPYFYKIFNVPIGYSDHTLGIDACIASVPLGSCVLEKHFTLDKNMEGPDQKLSADPKELMELVKKVRDVEKMIGKPRQNTFNSEKKFKNLMRRSIGVKKDLRKGTKIKKSMLTFFRPGDKIPPNKIEDILGRKLKKNVTKGTFLDWDMF